MVKAAGQVPADELLPVTDPSTLGGTETGSYGLTLWLQIHGPLVCYYDITKYVMFCPTAWHTTSKFW